MDKKNQVLMSVLGVFALVIVTVGVSYAFFTYSRTGTTTNTITSGEISFTYTEGADAVLSNAFPVADAVGIADTTGEYKFTVKGTVKGSADLKYDITLLSDNTATVGTGEGQVKGYFTNDQLKINLKNNATGAYAVGTESTGVLLSGLTAAKGTNTFTTGTTAGQCTVVSGNNAVEAGEEYSLKMWIDQNVDYSNTALTNDGTDAENDAQTSIGKFNGFTYSLKVKVDAAGTSNYVANPGA